MQNNLNVIDEFMDDTRKMVELVIVDYVEYIKRIPEYIKCSANTITTIVASYADPELEEYKEDALYWSELFKRIITGLNDTDVFKISDLLYFETVGSLDEYKKMIVNKLNQI